MMNITRDLVQAMLRVDLSNNDNRVRILYESSKLFPELGPIEKEVYIHRLSNLIRLPASTIREIIMRDAARKRMIELEQLYTKKDIPQEGQP